MKWRKISYDTAQSDCRRYYVRRFKAFGDVLYEALFKPTNGDRSEPIGHVVMFPDAAQRACEAHAAQRSDNAGGVQQQRPRGQR